MGVGGSRGGVKNGGRMGGEWRVLCEEWVEGDMRPRVWLEVSCGERERKMRKGEGLGGGDR